MISSIYPNNQHIRNKPHLLRLFEGSYLKSCKFVYCTNECKNEIKLFHMKSEFLITFKFEKVVTSCDTSKITSNTSTINYIL